MVVWQARTTDHILITGCFWENPLKEKALFDVAFSHGVPFLSISWIDQLYEVRPSIGDTLYDVNNNPYAITKDFIVTHPNDMGMEMIAKAIYNYVR